MLLIFSLFILLFWIANCISIFVFFKSSILSKKAENFKNLPQNELPLVSIIVSAKDEEKKIYSCLTSLVNLDYLNFEIVSVNDRSQDKTGEIIDKLALKNSKLKVIHIKELPSKWLGKNYAIHTAYKEANGEILLFIH